MSDQLLIALRAAQERWWRSNAAMIGAAIMSPTIAELLGALVGPPPQDVLDRFEDSMWATPTAPPHPATCRASDLFGAMHDTSATRRGDSGASPLTS